MYLLEFEVAGQLGPKTVIDTSVHPPIVNKLHFLFEGWLGDDMIECFPVYLVSERLKNKLENTNLVGYKIVPCEIEKSSEFVEIQPETILPNFFWFLATGDSFSDFSVSNNKMKMSDNAYRIVSQFNLYYATVEKI